jgi:hypothetical protein
MVGVHKAEQICVITIYRDRGYKLVFVFWELDEVESLSTAVSDGYTVKAPDNRETVIIAREDRREQI